MTVPATLENLERFGYSLNLDEWWVVSEHSKLARKIARCYPEFEPVIGDIGDLVDVIDLNLRRYHESRAEEKAQREAQRQRKIADAKARGYTRDFIPSTQPGALGFLQDVLEKKIQAASKAERGE